MALKEESRQCAGILYVVIPVLYYDFLAGVVAAGAGVTCCAGAGALGVAVVGFGRTLPTMYTTLVPGLALLVIVTDLIK